MQNNTRQITKIIKEICQENDIKLHSFSYDWFFLLQKNNKNVCIFGYTFEANNAAVKAICDDKCALSALLQHFGLPCVPHHFFMSPQNLHYIGKNDNQVDMQNLLKKYKKIVLKPNSGSGGKMVFLAQNIQQMDNAQEQIFTKHRALALAPYEEIVHEFRVITTHKQLRTVFKKLRPCVHGNGKDTILQLAQQKYESIDSTDLPHNLVDFDLSFVPAVGQEVLLNWKHNLAGGATPQLLTSGAMYEDLCKLSHSAISALNLNAASIDIILTKQGLKILEINSGIMMEAFAAHCPSHYLIAKSVYESLILASF